MGGYTYLEDPNHRRSDSWGRPTAFSYRLDYGQLSFAADRQYSDESLRSD